MTEILIATIECSNDTAIVTGYIQGIVRIGTRLRVLRQGLERHEGKSRVLPALANPREVNLVVTRITSFEREFTELQGIAGRFELQGMGGDLIQWRDVLSDS